MTFCSKNLGNLAMPRYRFTSSLTFILLCCTTATSGADDHHADDKPVRTITVSGEGKVKVKPDTASISAGVVTEAETAREALNKNNDQMQEVMAGMREAGIAEDDLQTAQFSVSPVYSRMPRKAGAPRVDPKIVGYRVSNTRRHAGHPGADFRVRLLRGAFHR